ncbi:MAG: CDP-alcohol phosphatidyltransferase family protein [Oscillospiraceae bacterium]|nr:CDP-alcohol phosphatidyltransferase family protein [Oscillospiraceae bacterium]
MKQHIPNILSAGRILLSPLLLIPAVVYRPAIYLPLYIIIFSTDILDGKIARRLHLESELGAKLDSIGDFLFFACALGSVAVSPLVIERRVLICIAIFFGLHFLIAFVTFIKFKAIHFTMHTYFAKLDELALALIIPIPFIMGRISFPVLAAYVGFTALYAIDGIATVAAMKTYVSSHKGITAEKIIAKQGEDGWFNKIFYFIFY